MKGTVVVTGGTGFIGRTLVRLLNQQGYTTVILASSANGQGSVSIDLAQEVPSAALFEGVESVVHLAGASLFQRWNETTKQAIYDSRVRSTQNLVHALSKVKNRPKSLISASASGYYGDRGEQTVTETTPGGTDFLARLCQDWEAEARQAENLGIRTAQVRTVPVLGKGGLLSLLLPIYKFGLGGPLGTGDQWFPWVHMADVVQVYLLALTNHDLTGPLNACAPQTIRYRDFSTTLAAVLRRPNRFRVPAWLLRLVVGELADAVMVSQKIEPSVLVQQRFHFAHPTLRPALVNIL